MSSSTRLVDRAKRIVIFAAAAASVACADRLTSPAPVKAGAKPTRDWVTEDSTLCRSGYVVIDSRIWCLGDNH